jgi:hypothetical protein
MAEFPLVQIRRLQRWVGAKVEEDLSAPKPSNISQAPSRLVMPMCGVEVWRGGLGGTYLLPTLSDGILCKLTCFKMTNATKPALPPSELVHVVVQQSDIRNQHCRCHQKLAAVAGYFCPISIRLLQGRRN